MGAGVVKSGGGGGRRRRHRGRAAAMSEINVTPFVDVMLVLMIIFMVAAPLMTVGVPIKLPETAASVMPTEQEKPLTISLTADGLVMVQTTEVKDEELIPKLKAIAAERTSDKIFVRADGAVTYARVAQVMGALNARGRVGGRGLIRGLHGNGLGRIRRRGQRRRFGGRFVGRGGWVWGGQGFGGGWRWRGLGWCRGFGLGLDRRGFGRLRGGRGGRIIDLGRCRHHRVKL